MNQNKNEKKKFLSEAKIEQLNKAPIIESFVQISEKGGHVIHRTVITDIRPIEYYEKVLARCKQ